MSTAPRKSKFDGIFAAREGEEAPPAADRNEKPEAPAAAPAPEPAPPTPVVAPPARSFPGAMNLKLTQEQSAALEEHRHRTGRGKQAIVSEAIDQWLRKNKSHVQT